MINYADFWRLYDVSKLMLYMVFLAYYGPAVVTEFTKRNKAAGLLLVILFYMPVFAVLVRESQRREYND